uniref:HNH endonuclease n=1 Tax=viral metagenome TaxID=1070528 RepID=A0A6M3K9A0_9ZZZZ
MAYKNLEDKKNYNKKWDRKNPEKRRAYCKQWREDNRDRYLKQRKEYYEKNKALMQEKGRLYYQEVKKIRRKKYPEKTKQQDRIAGLKRIAKLKQFIQQTKIDLGGKCLKCGYNKEPRILTFHHHNGNKVGNISEMKSLKKIRIEAAKCILLCPNCHALIHLNQC